MVGTFKEAEAPVARDAQQPPVVVTERELRHGERVRRQLARRRPGLGIPQPNRRLLRLRCLQDSKEAGAMELFQ